MAEARWGPLLFGLLGALCCASVSGFEPNLLEEGIELHVAQRLAQGEQLYRDVLVFTGPFPFELLGLLFRIAGEEIGVARAVVVGLHGLASAAAFALARAARPGALAHAAAAATATAPLLFFPLFGIYYYTTIAFHLGLVAGFAAWRGIRSIGWAFVAGVLVALIALSKQTIGLAIAVALGLALLVAASGAARRRALAGFVGGGAATALLSVGLWQLSGTLEHAIHGLVTLPASLDDSYQLPFVNLWPPGELTAATAKNQIFYLPNYYVLSRGILAEPGAAVILATQLLFALPLLAMAATAVRVARRDASPALVVHGALAVAWLVNLFPRTDWGHLSHVLPLAVAQLFLVVPGVARPTLRTLERVIAALVLVAFAGGAGLAWRTLDRIADPEPLSARVPLRPVSALVRGPQLRRVIEFLERRTRRGEPIFVARAEPLLYFATDTRNATPFPGVFPAMHETQERIILEGLRQTRFVVMSDVDQPAMTYYRDELPGVQAHLERFYRPAEDLGDDQYQWLTLLERGPDRGPTLVDFVQRKPSGRSFVRAAGEREPAAPFDVLLPTRRNRRPLAFPLGPEGGGIEFDLEVPEHAVFQADASLGRIRAADDVFAVPERATIVVSIGPPEAMAKLHELTLGTGWSPRWIPFEADLSAWAGRRVTLRMELLRAPEEKPSRIERIGYLGSPRIVGRRAPGAQAGP